MMFVQICYKYRMSKKAVSVTIEADNLLWLKGRTVAAGARSVSELLDRLITQARKAGGGQPARSIVGTIDIAPDDPWLEHADAVVRAAFDRSLGRPARLRESSPSHSARRSRKRRG